MSNLVAADLPAGPGPASISSEAIGTDDWSISAVSPHRLRQFLPHSDEDRPAFWPEAGNTYSKERPLPTLYQIDQITGHQVPKEYWELNLEYEEANRHSDAPTIEHLRFLLDPEGRQRAFEANQRLYQQALDRFDAEGRLGDAAGGRDGNLDDEYFVVRAPGGVG
ncbi:hypothetical protein B0T18DRAFT_391270 [Schizothecium vesticola]|uniref:Uncharacterized protein n=1 Tax=Schizothecium vesticola TaxID=314040 RepID=A0AA40EWP9_9PEZI|nr:hypothetical protein B0T18DRAFT_391270 [Schizothecium vesticola]